ncbi:MAG: SMP-30/gluconolactonase/LRE family protein [Acidobacteriota bacterium]|nr:SMP-30/gluconolactonase/LRE family protein [Acidobacteriota bacterium]
MKLTNLLLAAALLSAEEYKLGPDSQVRDVPHGKVTKYSFTASRIFPGTTRDYWVYIPAQYDPAHPACLTVFQDGGGFVNLTGAWRVPVVLDNLIADGAIPATVAIFVNPGVMDKIRYNRAFEYDGLGDRYARFLIEELIPEAAKTVSISANPDDRALAGSSSGGIASFTAAWNRPDAFHRVLSFIGSFTELKGGDIYPNLIRKMEPLPLRVFLQDGQNDQNIYGGNWFLANQSMFSALQYAGYESNFIAGTEAHNSKHGGAILPDALRWLWKGYPAPITKSSSTSGNRHYISEILDPASEWKLVSGGHQFTEGPAVNRNGEVFFVDTRTSQIYKVDTAGKVTVFKNDSGNASGLMFGPDGRLYAAQNGRKRIVAYTQDGAETVLTEGVGSNDLAVTSKGDIYFTEPATHKVWYLDTKGRRTVAHEGLVFPNGVRLSPDESLLLVSDTQTRNVWTFKIEPDRTLTDAEPFYSLTLPDAGPLRSNADGMTLDDQGFLYVATNTGIQICDQPGRVVGIIRKPGAANPSNVVMGGSDMQTLYVTAGDQVFSRHLRRKGVYPWVPVKLPVPQL